MTGQALEIYDEEAVARTERQLAVLDRQSKIYAKSGMVPKAFVDKPEAIAAVGLSLDALGVPLSLPALNQCWVEDGKVNLMAQLQSSLMRARGHDMWFASDCDEHSATVFIRRHGEQRVHRFTYTVDMARRNHRLDEWVERKYRNDGDRYDRTEKWVVAVDGVRVAELPDWATKQVELGRVKRYDAWFGSREAMLMCRAATRGIGKVCPEVLLGLPSGPPTDTAVPTGVDPETGEILKEDIVEGEVVEDDEPVGGDAAAPTEPPAAEPVDDGTQEDLDGKWAHAAEHRNECTKIHSAIGRIPAGEWRERWAAAWREAGLPEAGAHELTPEQLEPARLLVRQYIALAALDSVRIAGPPRRHAFVKEATGGETESTKALTAEQLTKVLAAVRAEHERQAAAAGDEEQF